MQRFYVAAVTLAVLAAAPAGAQNAPANALSASEAPQGWILLFDGKSLDGWEARPTERPRNGQAAAQPDWTVKNGALVCGGTVPSWIGTTASFSDYTLQLEFKGPESVNSGVFVRSQKEGQPHQTGYEVNIWNSQPAGYNTGSLVGSVKAPMPAKILDNEWNRFEVTADGDHFVVALNGQTILDAHDSLHASGVVGLQCQRNNRIEFRNIRLLPKGK